MNEKEIKLNDKQLNEVTGGAIKKDSGSNGKTYVKCEPRFYKYPVNNNSIVTYIQKPSCSDTAFKGLKPECEGCEANK